MALKKLPDQPIAPIETALAALIQAQGYELVRVEVLGGAMETLQIMAERVDGQGISVSDCSIISRIASDWLESQPDYAERFALEVSSPGIDRPLVRLKDYQRFQGHLAKVELSEALMTSSLKPVRRFQGKIARISDAGDIAFATDTGEVSVALDKIAKAKLVITQDLLNMGAVARKQANAAQ